MSKDKDYKEIRAQVAEWHVYAVSTRNLPYFTVQGGPFVAPQSMGWHIVQADTGLTSGVACDHRIADALNEATTTRQQLAMMERERDEAREVLTQVDRWLEDAGAFQHAVFCDYTDWAESACPGAEPDCSCGLNTIRVAVRRALHKEIITNQETERNNA